MSEVLLKKPMPPQWANGPRSSWGLAKPYLPAGGNPARVVVRRALGSLAKESDRRDPALKIRLIDGVREVRPGGSAVLRPPEDGAAPRSTDPVSGSSRRKP